MPSPPTSSGSSSGTSNNAEPKGGPGGATDPFSIDVNGLDKDQMALLNQQKLDSLNTNIRDLVDIHKRTEKKIAQNKSDLGVIKANQRIIFQDVNELKRQVDRTHKFVKNKHDEQIRDTLEAFREDRNIVVWGLKRTELIPYRRSSEDEKEVYRQYAFDKVKGFLPWVEEIDIRGSVMNNQPEDNPGDFRILIKFTCSGDAEKFRVRMVATGHIFIRKGMSKLTRTLCGETKQLAKYLSEKEDPSTGLEYSTKYQFSIIQHTKGNKDDVKKIMSSINRSKDWETPKIRNTILLPFKDVESAEGDEDADSEARSETMEHSGQDYGRVGEDESTEVSERSEDPNDTNRSSEASGEQTGKRKRSEASGGSPGGAQNNKRSRNLDLDKSIEEVAQDFFEENRDRSMFHQKRFNWKNKQFSGNYNRGGFQPNYKRGGHYRDNRYDSNRFGGNGGGGNNGYRGSYYKHFNGGRGFRNGGYQNYNHRGGFNRYQGGGHGYNQDGYGQNGGYYQGRNHGGYDDQGFYDDYEPSRGRGHEEPKQQPGKKRGRPKKDEGFSSVNTSPLGEPASNPLTQEQRSRADKVPDNYETFDKETLKQMFVKGGINRFDMAYKIAQLKSDMAKVVSENKKLKSSTMTTATPAAEVAATPKE